jgi:hypothetical protein
MKEWLAGSLAVALELPVPPFEILHVSRSLYDVGRNGSLSDLGHGPVFGSKAVANVNEITTTEAARISSEMRRRIAVFDWWIMNGDRTLSESGGNPNILWHLSMDGPFIIDHNLAFDGSVGLAALETNHIFGSALTEVIESPSMQESWSKNFEQCLQKWDQFCGMLPERWSYLDDQRTVSSGFDPSSALAILRRFDSPAMWTRS